MNKIELAIFDWDGTVADSAQLQVDAEQVTATAMAEELGLDFDVATIDWSQMQGWARKKIAAHIFDADDELQEAYRERVVDETVGVISQDVLQPIPGAIGFVDFLKHRGVRRAVASSSSSKILRPSIGLFGMENDFSMVVGHREAIDDKPHAGQYRRVMQEMGVLRENTLVLEDSKTGIDSGKAAGALVVAIATTKSYDYLRKETMADIVAHDYRHAVHLLQPYLP